MPTRIYRITFRAITSQCSGSSVAEPMYNDDAPHVSFVISRDVEINHVL